MKSAENIIVGISIGDLNGIGPEVVLKTFEDSRMLELCTPVIFANVKSLSFLRKSFESTVNIHGIDNLDQLVPGKLNVLNVWREGFDLTPGKLDETVGKYAIKSFKAAVAAAQEGKIHALVTAPINKINIQDEDFKFPGHTDYLNEQFEGNALMLMVSDTLRVGLLTDHVPLAEVASKLNEGLIRKKVETLQKSLIQDFSIRRPRIAILGLNPHAGDGGVIGVEDKDIIAPAIKKLFDAGTLVFGPYPADGFFGSGQYKQFDAVLATYHDQGLAPFKALSFGGGVNFTAGLNLVRTSPDHGTAYDIAGKGKADETSFKEAVYLAIDVVHSREHYQEMTANPLKTKEKQL